jgi:hypothetical protein
MAGTLTNLRQDAEWKLKKAEEAGASKQDIAVLRAHYEALSLKEDLATGRRR